MSVLKWVLIVLGVLVLIGFAVIAGVVYWASTVESVKLTVADLDVGGAYPTEERQHLLDACRAKQSPPGSDGPCSCIADRAGTDLSRFERLIFTAGFEGNPTRIAGVVKGLIDSGIPQAKIDALEKDSGARFESLVKACGK